MPKPSTVPSGGATLIERSASPPNYETSVAGFRELVTANDDFFVRYHHGDIPAIAASDWRLEVGGEGVSSPFDIGLDELKRVFEPIEIAAVCQCSGNRRGLLGDKVPGVQWGEGAVGNARWTGARLKDVLARAQITEAAVEIATCPAAGLAGPADEAPPFDRSLPTYKALHPDTILAYAMNGEPLPRHNGFPVRLAVPGWTAVHWVKHVARIEARLHPLRNRWMADDYRVPAGLFATTQPFMTQATAHDEPVTEIMVASMITSHQDGASIRAGPIEIGGVAWDGGHGIAKVELSIDGAASWARCALGPDIGRYSFRGWTTDLGPLGLGRHQILVKATNMLGDSQPLCPLANPSGYLNNSVARLGFEIV